MIIEIAKHERMSESGKSLLRLIQNNDTPRLDLLVRESLQNCLDAGLGIESNKFVSVDICTSEFRTEDISSIFGTIDSNLNKRFPGTQKCISIKDWHTTGLTGPLCYEDIKEDGEFGNLLKLIYEISKPQEKDGSGGSWGLGKTVYFRIGCGLVVYYSRIFDRDKNRYAVRLAAALVEDETRKDALLPYQKLGRGIAWWGQKDLRHITSGHTIPLTNEGEINRILSKFKIEPYKGEETGTTIIIPFIDEKALLEETRPVEDDEDQGTTKLRNPYWTDTVEQYIRIAAQRWYAPRLGNKYYKYGQYLQLSVNRAVIAPNSMEPVFRLIQTLYNASNQEISQFNDKQIVSEPILLRTVFDLSNDPQGLKTSAGTLNFIKVNASDLQMTPPDNKMNPFYYINRPEDAGMSNPPIFCFTRKPGMIVNYDTTGSWVNGIASTGSEEYIIGIFTAESENRLKVFDITLEEYLRNGEKADHKAWSDWTDPKNSDYHPGIVAKIQKNCIKKIQTRYAEMASGEGDQRNFGLGKMLADFLLPPDDFSKWDEALGGSSGTGGSGGDGSSTGDGSGSGSTVNNTSHVLLKQLGEPVFTGNGIEIKLQILFGKKRYAKLEMNVLNENRQIDCSKWEEEMGEKFPLKMKGARLLEIRKGKKRGGKTIFAEERILNENDEVEDVEFSTIRSSRYEVPMAIEVKTPAAENYAVTICLTYIADKVNGTVTLSEN